MAQFALSTQTTPDLLLLTLNMVWWGRNLQRPPYEGRIFDMRKAMQGTEYTLEMQPATMGAMKPEGAPLAIATAGEAFKTAYPSVTYGNSIYLTMEEMQDNLYKRDWNPRALGFAQAQEVLRNTVVFSLFNNSNSNKAIVDGGSQGADQQPLLSTQHPMMNGVYANTWATPTTLSMQTYTEMIEGIQSFQNFTGYPLEYVPKLLLISIQNARNAKTLMFSPDDPTTADRAINANFGDYFKEGIIVTSYLRDPQCFFGITNAEAGFAFYRRMEFTIQDLPGSNTLVYGYFGVERFAVGYDKANAVYGSTFLLG